MSRSLPWALGSALLGTLKQQQSEEEREADLVGDSSLWETAPCGS